jgi:hypothetical protein
MSGEDDLDGPRLEYAYAEPVSVDQTGAVAAAGTT